MVPGGKGERNPGERSSHDRDLLGFLFFFPFYIRNSRAKREKFLKTEVLSLCLGNSVNLKLTSNFLSFGEILF